MMGPIAAKARLVDSRNAILLDGGKRFSPSRALIYKKHKHLFWELYDSLYPGRLVGAFASLSGNAVNALKVEDYDRAVDLQNECESNWRQLVAAWNGMTRAAEKDSG